MLHRSRILGAAVLPLLLALPMGAVAGEPPTAAAVNKRVGRAVNVLGYDPIWKSRAEGRFQEKHFRLIREAGFDAVRINLHPFRAMDEGPGHRLAAAWLGWSWAYWQFDSDFVVYGVDKDAWVESIREALLP